MHKIGAENEIAQDSPQPTADREQMLEVLLNILNNAEYEMVGSHGGGRITIRGHGSGDTLRISISDDGPGIAAEHMDRIFDPFFTTKDVGAGTGLGLSISYGIIEQHGGNLWASSNPWQGATFHLDLPVKGLGDDHAGGDETGETEE